MLSDLKDTHIKELACVFDPGSRPTFVTLYMNMERRDERFLEKRKSMCRTVLRGERALLDNFNRTMEKVEKLADEKEREHGQKGLAVFASDSQGFLKAFKLALPVENLLVVDASPYIRPLAELVEDYETFGLILLDSHRAKLYVVSSGMVEYEDKLAEDIMNKHKKGGWSQARFQRLRKGAIERFMNEVSEAASKLFSKDDVRKIVIAGPGEAKTMLSGTLHFDMRQKIAGIIDTSFDGSESGLVCRAEGLIYQRETETVESNLERLRGEILRHGLAVYGMMETANAVRNGQAELLLILRGCRLRGWVCEKCQLFGMGAAAKCPGCSGAVSEADVIEEITELAERSDTKIEFVDDSTLLNELGGVGGFLRYR